MNPRLQVLVHFVALALAGWAIWTLITLATGEAEAWDSSLFWFAGLPAMVLIGGVAGLAMPQRFWLWGLAIVFPQALSLFLNGDEGDGLGGVGLLFFLLLAGFLTMAALGGARLRARVEKKGKASA